MRSTRSIPVARKGTQTLQNSLEMAIPMTGGAKLDARGGDVSEGRQEPDPVAEIAAVWQALPVTPKQRFQAIISGALSKGVLINSVIGEAASLAEIPDTLWLRKEVGFGDPSKQFDQQR